MNEGGWASKQHGSPWPPPPGGRRRGMVRAVSLPLGFARLTAIHAALPGWARRMPRHSAKFMAAALFVLSAFSASPVWGQATLGNLAPGSFQSGVGVISGWVCEAERIDIVLSHDFLPFLIRTVSVSVCLLLGCEGQLVIFWRMVCTSSAETRRHAGRRKVRPARWVNTTMSHVSG